jgi:hypothetical protein
LIDEDFANRIYYDENSEYLNILLDNNDHFLEGIKTNGTKVFNTPIENDVTEISSIYSNEFLKITTDHYDKNIEGVRSNGQTVSNFYNDNNEKQFQKKISEYEVNQDIRVYPTY